MTLTSHRKRAAISAVGTAVVAALAVAVAPAAHGQDLWGAIATGPNGQWRIAHSYADKSSAVFQAKYYIIGGRLVLTFNDCGALAQNNTGFSGASGPTQGDAESSALGDLGGSTIVASACNAGSSAGVLSGP
jgi:hypothetical protein